MDRRTFLTRLGGAAVAFSSLGVTQFSAATERPSPLGFAGRFVEVPRPVPPRGRKVAETFELIDDLVVPDDYSYEILARWGDRFGALEFGANADHTAILPIAGRPGAFHLMVNHEYISAIPWLQGFNVAKGRELPELELDSKGFRLGGQKIAGRALDLQALAAELATAKSEDRESKTRLMADARVICREALDDLGVSLLEVELRADGGLRVAPKGRHRRISAIKTLGIAREDAPSFRGPGAGRLEPAGGTMSNCSGGTSPWGSFFTCEENYQDYTTDEVGADGNATTTRKVFGVGGGNKALGLPGDLRGIGQGAPDGPLDGRRFGWVAEIDPRSGRLTKQIALGRFRHENVAIAAAAGRRLAVYMGDDRRGGHVWKYLSDEKVKDPSDPANSLLLEQGSLLVAAFQPDHQGHWLALEPETPLVLPRPELCAEGAILVPRRSRGGDPGVGGFQRVGRGGTSVADWVSDVEGFAGKRFAAMTLADLVRPEVGEGESLRELQRWTILMDAFAMANCIGATPTARPEDLECVFGNEGSLDIFVAFTDFGGDADGSPRLDVFPDAEGRTSRRYGSIHHLAENRGDPASMTFSWGIVAASGEDQDGGGGFAAPDNIALDPDGEMWIVTDMADANSEVADRAEVEPGSKKFKGIFGNNAMWWLPRDGAPRCFASAPMEAELTGPTFLRGKEGEVLLLLSVQHPGEVNGKAALEESRLRHYAIREGEKRVVLQGRKVPRGSRFAAREDGVPRSAVCVIRRLIDKN